MTQFVGNRITLPKLAAAPSTPASGDAYYNTVDNTAYIYNGTSWLDLAAAGGGGPIALGTNTTGNYMVDVSVQNGLSVSHTPGEGSTATIGVNNALLSNYLLEGASGNSYGLIGTSEYLDVKNTNGYNKEIELDIVAVETKLNTDGYITASSTSTLTNKSLTSPVVTGTAVIDNNAASPVSTSNAQGTVLQLVNADAANTRIVQDAHGSGVHGAYTIRRSRGTAASPTAVQADDKLGELGARGYGATQFSDQSQGRVSFYASETWTDSVAGTYATVEVTAAGTNGVSSGLTVTSSAISLPSGSELKINGNSVLSASTLGSGVTASSLTSVGTITTGTWTGTAIAIASGGTGATTAQNARNAILPTQASNANKFLRTDGSDVSWDTALTSVANETIDGGGA